ncbi:MAG: recombinase family protein [Chloroflexi bacterium]|nr:recombinase family protein [Chloroflexota bacterium]
MKRAVLSARVSTDEQAEKGYSLPSQLEACRKYAELHGFSVVGEFTDDISGVIPIAERPGGRQVQAMVDSKATDAVIVYRVDRMARDTVELLITTRAWLRAGIELHFCDMGKVKSENDILLVIRGWAGNDEREKIRERTKRGKDAKARNGLVVSATTTPYGYTFNGGHIMPNEQAQIVKDIFTWYVHGNGDGERLSINAIAKKLSKMRVTTPGELKGGGKRRRSSGVWNTATIYKILRNRTYCGVWEWGAQRWRDGTPKTQPAGDAITVQVPSIVDATLWKAAQERRERNKRMSKRNVKHNYLLRGRVYCCGYSMVGNCSHGNLSYRCNHYHIKRFEKGKGCRRYIRCDVLDPIVWGYVLDIATNLETFRELLLESQQQELDALQPKRERLLSVEDLIQQAEAEAGKFALALVNAQGVVGDMLKKQIDDVNARHVAMCTEHDTLTAEIEQGALTDEQIAVILAMFNQDVIAGLQNATFEDKQRTLDDLRVVVYITGGNARVTCRIPRTDSVIALTHSLSRYNRRV